MSATVPELPVLTLVGRASATARAAIGSGLPTSLPADDVTCFATFSPAEFPIGAEFNVVFDEEGRTGPPVLVQCRLVAVTQQFGVALAEVPIGWRTVCVLRFAPPIPDLVAALPVVDSWSRGTGRVHLCAIETFSEIQKGYRATIPRALGQYLYSVWFRDDTLPADDQDHEWVACFLIEADSPEAAQAAGDELALARAQRAQERFLRSSVALPTGAEDLPLVRAGDVVADGHIGW